MIAKYAQDDVLSLYGMVISRAGREDMGTQTVGEGDGDRDASVVQTTGLEEKAKRKRETE